MININFKAVKAFALLSEDDVETYINSSLDNLKDQDQRSSKEEAMRNKISEWSRLDGVNRLVLVIAKPVFNTTTEEALAEIIEKSVLPKERLVGDKLIVDPLSVISPIGHPHWTKELLTKTGKTSIDLFEAYIEELNENSQIAILLGASDTRVIAETAMLQYDGSAEDASVNVISYIPGMQFTLAAEFVTKGSIQLEVGSNKLNHWRTSIEDVQFSGIALKFVENNAILRFNTKRKAMRIKANSSNAGPLDTFLLSLKRIAGVEMVDLKAKADEFGLVNTPESKADFLRVVTGSLVEA